MSKPTLVILAAGMGSRFGGLKQITPVGPAGEKIIDYSIYDAIRAGFGKIVFVIKKAIEEEFKEQIGNAVAAHVPVEYVYQELDTLPEGYTVPEGRVKPWGTGHAVLCCRDVVKEPFAVINADDYYGRSCFGLLADFLSKPQTGEKKHIAMAGYRLRNTLTENGYVSRGICEVDEDDRLISLTERTHIEIRQDGPAFTEDEGASWVTLRSDCYVSMNCWAFPAGSLGSFEELFCEFLDKKGGEQKAEFYLPFAVDAMIAAGEADVQVLPTEDKWYGMTYAADHEMVRQALAQLTTDGVYPSVMWEKETRENPVALAERAAWQFGDDTFLFAEPYGEGHINETYAAYYRRVDGTEYRNILQKINNYVFPDVDGLMENIKGVTDYLRGIVGERETMTVIPTKDGKAYYLDPDGNYWRSYIFIENATAYQKIEKDEDFFTCGVSFGRFQQQLADYPAHLLHETIVNFHNTPSRYKALHAAIAADKAGRAAEVAEQIAFALEREVGADVLVEGMANGTLPCRVTHNDTKLNNILIDDETGRGQCVIDLDTVMPGAVAFDFGDCIRFGASTAAEDETDLSKVEMSLHLFRVFTDGYLSTAAPFLTQAELDSLVDGARLMTLECGVRFLTDYLDGDVYFRIHRPRHNLDRCLTQFKLVADMEQKEAEMRAIVKELAEKYK